MTKKKDAATIVIYRDRFGVSGLEFGLFVKENSKTIELTSPVDVLGPLTSGNERRIDKDRVVMMTQDVEAVQRLVLIVRMLSRQRRAAEHAVKQAHKDEIERLVKILQAN